MKIAHWLAIVVGIAVSEASLAASGFVVAGSVQLLQAGSQLVVTGMQAAGESTVVVMRGVSEGVTVSVRMSAQLAREASVAAGTAVRVVAESVGYSLYVGVRLIAFVPAEAVRALIHQSRHGAPATK
jgi:hypothetical protein